MEVPQTVIQTRTTGRGTAGGANPTHSSEGRPPGGQRLVSFVDSSNDVGVAAAVGHEPSSHHHLNPLFDFPEKCSVEKSESETLDYPLHPVKQTEGTKPALAKRQSTKQLLRPKNSLEHEVSARDTVEKIAIRYGTTPSAICKMNKMASRMIFPGQVLFVPDPDAPPPSPSPTKEATSPPPTTSSGGDIMFPAAATSTAVDDNLPKILPSLPTLSSVAEGVSEVGKDAGATATSQISNLFSKLNPATHISRSSFRKKREKRGSGGSDDESGMASSGDIDPDQECLERFIKLSAKHITDGRGVVGGTLLVTPNAVMFDPDVMDPLVRENGPEMFGMIAPMECIMSSAIYHDISPMTVDGTPGERDSAAVYHDKTCPLYEKQGRGRCSEDQGAEPPQGNEEEGSDSNFTDDRKRPSPEVSPEQRFSVALAEGLLRHEKRRRRVPGRSATLPEQQEAPSATPERRCRCSSSSDERQRSPEKSQATAPASLEADFDAAFETPTNDEQKKMPLIESSPEASAKVPLLAAVHEILGEADDDSFQQPCDECPEDSATPSASSSKVLLSTEFSSSEPPIACLTTTYPGLGAGDRSDLEPSGLELAKPENSSLETKDVEDEAFVVVENMGPEEAQHLFVPIETLLPKPQDPTVGVWQEPPLYLCLRVGQPLNKKIPLTGPIAAYARKKKRPEYWFSIPKERAPHLYAFFLQWTPEVYDNQDLEQQQAFVLLGNDDDEDEFIRQLPVSKQWEIVNTDEIERRRSLLLEESYPPPELLGVSQILDADLAKQLNFHLPARTVGYPWSLTFSTEEHGFSLSSLYRKMAALPEGPVLLFIQDTQGRVFGAMSSCAFVVSDHFYGNGEMFLFSRADSGDLRCYPWSGENNFFIKGNKESLAIGAGEGLFGLWLDEDLYHGRSHPCPTFANETLSTKEDFVIKILEIWTFLE